MTCSKHEFIFPIGFLRDQDFPGHSASCPPPVGILCTRLRSPMFFSSLPCRICRFKLRLSSRCYKATYVCLFPFDGCFMEWPNVLSFRWHVICDIFLRYFDFEGIIVTTPQYVSHFLSRSCKSRCTKSCMRVHAYWSYAIYWDDLYLLDIPRNFCSWAHLGVPHRQKYLWCWWPRYNPMYWVIRKYCVNVVTHVLWVILDMELWWKHSFLHLTQLDVKVRSRSGQIRLNL